MIIVTGANGFIGSMMVWQLEQAGLGPIVAVDLVDLEHRSQPLKNRRIEKFLTKDQLWDFLNLSNTKKETRWVIHMGANSSTTEPNRNLLLEMNTEYTTRLFQWCSENAKPIIYASSAATYGAGELGYDDQLDSEQLKPLNYYGESKVLFDRWVVKQIKTPPYWYGLKFFNVYGPNEEHKDSMSSLVFKAFHQIQQTGKLKLFKSYIPSYKDGEQMRDFVYVKDVTAWMLELIQKQPKSGIYNMGFGQARTWNALGKQVFKSLGNNENIDYIDMPENIRNQYQYYTKAEMNTWFEAGMSEPKWSLENGVDDYIKYLLKKKVL